MTHTPRPSAVYRADIDGLRAIAVLSVVIFHVDVAWFSGGFVGVDIFFVISGFLITGNIANDIELGRWSFKDFYIRRWRRLFPAYLFTIMASFIVAFLLFSPDHLQRFCQSLLFSMVYASNFFFWQEAGYFDVSSNFKPLLHMWSLAVEEQFYIVWPLTLFLLTRLKHSAAIPVAMVVLGILSLLACEYYLPTDASAVFYLLPFRVFEFAIGGLMTRLVSPRQIMGWLHEVLLAAGLLLIGYSVVTFDEHTVFPGFNALIPCVGTALVIYSGRARYTGILLRNRLSVGLGLISYSAYLVHWPLVIFYKYWAFAPLTPASQFSVVAASFLLAYFIYRFVEQPFRYKRNATSGGGNSAFLAGCIAAMVLVAIPAAHAWVNQGWEWRVASDQGQIIPSHLRPEPLHCEPPQCSFGARREGPVDVLIIGDSHSSALWRGFDYLGRKYDLKMLGWRIPGCYPVFNSSVILEDNAFLTRRCRQTNPEWEDFIEMYRPRYVVLAARWAYATERPAEYALVEDEAAWLVDGEHPERDYDKSREILSTRLQETVTNINRLGSRVILVSQVPMPGIDPSACQNVPTYLYNKNFNTLERCQYAPYNKLRERLQFADELILNISRDNTGVHAIFLGDMFCSDDSQSCKVFDAGALLYKDYNHLNGQGAMFVARSAEKNLQKFLSSE